jgi:hypothetical protein
MPHTRTNPESKSLFRLTSRLVCLLALVAVAEWVNATSKAQGVDRFSCVLVARPTKVTILSCGSSAGNFFYTCGGVLDCIADTDPANQLIADLTCADYAQLGCPPTDFGDDDFGYLTRNSVPQQSTWVGRSVGLSFSSPLGFERNSLEVICPLPMLS